MDVGSLVKLRKNSFHNRGYLGFENMTGIIIDMQLTDDRLIATVLWNDKRFKITEWHVSRLTAIQNLYKENL